MTGATIDLPATADFQPPLATFELKPTWVNRAGRVDRTACVEIRASELWPHATFREVKRHPKAGETSYLEAIATITLGARFLYQRHVDRNPLKLQGAWRTSKSNVMKRKAVGNRQWAFGGEGTGHSPGDLKAGRPEGQSAKPPGLQASKSSSQPTSLQASKPAPPRGGTDERNPFDAGAQRRAYKKYDYAFVRDHPLPATNPNRGAPFSSGGKQIGLRSDCTQEIVIERWRLHERLAKHFLVCPSWQTRGTGHLALDTRVDGSGTSDGPHSSPNAHRRSAAAECLVPSASPCRNCCGKALKLFTPTCSIQESNDSDLAEGWIKLVDARYAAAARPMPPVVIEMRHRLLQRYGLLFRGRRLVCRKCLGVRYGEVKGRKLNF